MRQSRYSVNDMHDSVSVFHTCPRLQRCQIKPVSESRLVPSPRLVKRSEIWPGVLSLQVLGNSAYAAWDIMQKMINRKVKRNDFILVSINSLFSLMLEISVIYIKSKALFAHLKRLAKRLINQSYPVFHRNFAG